MQPRKKSHSVDEGTGESGVKRRSVYSGKARLPGTKKPRTSNAEKSGGPLRPQHSMDTIAFDTDGAATGLEQVVSSVAERMLPEINKKIETIISQRLDTSIDEEGTAAQATRSAEPKTDVLSVQVDIMVPSVMSHVHFLPMGFCVAFAVHAKYISATT